MFGYLRWRLTTVFKGLLNCLAFEDETGCPETLVITNYVLSDIPEKRISLLHPKPEVTQDLSCSGESLGVAALSH